MTFQFFKAFPPDREDPVVELHVHHGHVIDIPAEISRADGRLRIELFARDDGVSREYDVEEWIDAIRRAAEILDA